MKDFNLMHGDCLQLMKSIPDGSIDMVLTDPPYGTTRNKWDSIIPLDLMWAELNRICKPNAAKVFFAQTPFDKILGASNIKQAKYEFIWEKEAGTGFLNAKKMPLKNHENIVVFYKEHPTYNPQMRSGYKPYKCKQSHVGTNYGAVKPDIFTESNGERYPLTVLSFNRDQNKLHPTQKPVALLEYLIKTYTNPGETVLDFTMGSGSTGVACINTGRQFIGIELDEKYFLLAQERIASVGAKKDHQTDLLGKAM